MDMGEAGIFQKMLLVLARDEDVSLKLRKPYVISNIIWTDQTTAMRPHIT
jgi:hypothetical protein